MLKGAMKDLKTAGGISFEGYQTGAGSAGVVMVHEWWGLNEGIKRMADELAATLPLRVLAVDLYGGKIATTSAEAGAAMDALDEGEAVGKCVAGIADLSGASGAKVGIIGWCMGGGLSLRASLAAPGRVSATCIYYGDVAKRAAELATLEGPVLGIFADKDGWITAAMAKAFDSALAAAKVPHTVKIFPAGHAFANPSGENYDAKCAAEAWRMTIDFFSENLLSA